MPELTKPVLSPTRRNLFAVLAAAGSIIVSKSASADICPPQIPADLVGCAIQQTQCFLRGTHIRTTQGETPIEDVAAGDLVLTTSGARPIKRVSRELHNNDIPVRISGGTLGAASDLYVSPMHALFIDGVLIPAMHLVNGTSIVKGLPAGIETAEYFHIELETHEVIFAEGVLTETLHTPGMEFYAPVATYNGGKSELKALLRRLASPMVDVRDPIQLAYDRICARRVQSIFSGASTKPQRSADSPKSVM